jgi:hypothetical protein
VTAARVGLHGFGACTSMLAINLEPAYGIIAAGPLLSGEHRQIHPGFFAETTAIR